MKRENLFRLVKLALLAALSIVLVMLVRFPIIPAAPYLEYDMADVPILVAALLYGPWSGILLTFVVSVLQGITVSAASGWVGIAMHFFATSAFVLAAGCIYRIRKTFPFAIGGLCAGVLLMTTIMIPLNLIFTVYFNGVPADVVKGMIWPVIVPFNLIKAGANATLTVLLFKPIGFLFKKADTILY